MDSTTPLQGAQVSGAPHLGLSTGDRFFDRAGGALSRGRWAQLRRDPEYTVLGDWNDGNGSAVRTVWTGMDGNHGHSETLMFETHCLAGDTANYYLHGTEDEARQSHDDCVGWLGGDGKPRETAAGLPAVLPLDFFDRRGRPITAARWEHLRGDPSYSVIERWRGEGGAHVEVFWTGFDRLCGFHARPQVFGLCVSAFENCPQSDCSYRFFTEKRALDHFWRITELVERGIRPWDDDDVEAAGFAPLTLRAW